MSIYESDARVPVEPRPPPRTPPDYQFASARRLRRLLQRLGRLLLRREVR